MIIYQDDRYQRYDPIKIPIMMTLDPIGAMYGTYANIWGILMVNDTIYGIHGSYGYVFFLFIGITSYPLEITRSMVVMERPTGLY